MKTFLLLLFTFGFLTAYNQSSQKYIYIANNEYITSIAEGSNCIWLGTKTGLISINKATGQKTVFNKANSEIPFNNINKVFSKSNGSIWLTNDFGRIARYSNNNWSEINKYNSILPDDKIVSITEDKDGFLWFGTARNGVVKYTNPGMGLIKSYMVGSPPIANILSFNYSMTVDSLNNHWFGAANGVTVYRHTNYWQDYWFFNSLTNDEETTVLKLDNSGTVWGATGSHIPKPGLQSGQLFYYVQNYFYVVPDHAHLLKNIQDLAFDNSNNVYIATVSNGVIKYDGNNFIPIPNNSNMDTCFTTSLLYDSNGTLWIGTVKGLYKMNGNNTLEKVEISKYSSLPTNYWLDFYRSTNGSIYLEYKSKSDTNSINNEYNTVLLKNNDTIIFENPTLSKDSVHFICEDNNGDLLCSKGFNLYKIQDTIYYTVHIDTTNLSLTNSINDITWDKYHQKFLAATQNGLYEFSNNQWQFISYFMNNSNDTMISLLSSTNNTLWVGSKNKGIASFKNGTWKSYNSSWILFNADIDKIIEDNVGNIWFYDKQNVKIAKYSSNNWNIFTRQNTPLANSPILDIGFDSTNLYVLQENTNILVNDGSMWDSLSPYNSDIDEYIINIFSDINNNQWFIGTGILAYNKNGIVLTTDKKSDKEASTSELIIFPNPASKLVYIENIEKGLMNIQVFDLQGRLIINKLYNGNINKSIPFETSSLKNGVYLVSVNYKESSIFRKLIINK